MNILFALPAALLGIVLLLLTLVAAEVGFRIGRRATEHVDHAVGVVQASVLGLMAFLLGLSFSFAAGRYETRHDLEQKEANCLGTAYVRTQLIVNPLGARIRALLPVYTQARIDCYLAGVVNQDAFQVAKAKCDDLQNQIWNLDIELFKSDKSDRRTDLLTQSLNNSFDAAGDLEEARRHHVPSMMFNLLFLAVLISGGFVGYGFGRTSRRVIAVWILFAALTAITISVILDLDQPERGMIKNTHEPLRILHSQMG